MNDFNDNVPMPIEEIEAHLALVEADRFADSGEWDAALDRLSAAFDELPHPEVSYDLAVRMANIAIEAHRPDVARHAALTALAINIDSEQSVDALLTLGHAMSDLGEHDAALELYEAAREYFVAGDDLPGVAHVDMNVAIIYNEQHRTDEALELLEWSAVVFADHECWDDLAACRVNFVAALRHAKRFDEAAAMATDAINSSRLLGDQLQLANALFNGANVDLDMDCWEPARVGFIEAMEIYRKLNLPTEHADCLDALGVIGRHDGLLDYAAAMHTEAIRLYEGKYHDVDQAAARYNLAITQFHLGRFADARATATLAGGVLGSSLDPSLVIAAAAEALGDTAEAARLRAAFLERHGQEEFDDEVKAIS